MNFTQEQITSIIDECAKEKGYDTLMKMILESIMKAERHEFNGEFNDSSNGFRQSSVFAHGGQIELAVPRSRHHNFYPLLLAIINHGKTLIHTHRVA